MLSKCKNALIAAFLPKRCPYCNAPIKVSDNICADCAEKVKIGLYEKYAAGGYKCKSPFMYTGIYKKALLNFKFHSRPAAAQSLALPLAECIKSGYGDIRFDCAACVPMHKNQLRKRGYNQSELLAKEVSGLLNLQYQKLLIKTKDNQPQHTLGQTQRRNNVKGVYKAVNTECIQDKTVLLIDDVLTTGYTLGECCKVLRKAGAKQIYCAALCCAMD